MTKDEIKKAFDICFSAQKSCNGCPLLVLEKQNGRGCKYNLFTSVFDLVTEQEKEINALQEENRRLDEYVSCTLSAQEFDEEIKQAKIDVLNELWEKVKDEGVDYKIGMRALSEEIDELIKEVKNER